jgi:DNA repair protein RecN (Recombination protein N)
VLNGLSIRDIVLIDALALDIAETRGLCVLTGETGAGKSILLDALGLALGGRADRGLVRAGCRQGSVIAAFDLEADHPVTVLLAECGLATDGDALILRRVLAADGRSRAFVNDQPVSVSLLRSLGDLLVEIHGQHDVRSLLDPATHRTLVDRYGGHEPAVAAVARGHGAWRSATETHAALSAEVEQARREELYWRQVHDELAELDPQPGEEAELAESRARLMHRERLIETVQDGLTSLAGQDGAAGRLGQVERRLGRNQAGAELLAPALAAVQRAYVETNEAVELLEAAGRELTAPGRDLEQIEERLFALRALARKHRTEVDRLAELRAETERRLGEVDKGGERLEEAALQAAEARADFAAAAERLGVARRKAGVKLARAVAAELAPLKLDKARLAVEVEPLSEDAWGPNGAERIGFVAAMNPGQDLAPVARVASGGELARLLLALKVVLAGLGSAGTLVFDEVDAGVGGATADAVGERLARLAGDRQVLVVTHSPQVAARADHHWRVVKSAAGKRSAVTVERLDGARRREEIARMLAGAQITSEARAAADSLMRRSA